MHKSITVQCQWNLPCRGSWMRKSSLSINSKSAANLKTSSVARNTTSQHGSDTPNGKKDWKNLPERGLFTKERFKLSTQTEVYGWNTRKWRWRISLSTMLEMCGKGLLITCLERTSFGLSTLTWKKSWGSLKKRGMFLEDGWSGSQVKKLGWLTLSLSREWVNLKRPRTYSISTFKPTLLWPPT